MHAQGHAQRRLTCQDSVRTALASATGGQRVQAKLQSSDSETSLCEYVSDGERVSVEVLSIPQAYEQFNVANTHQSQANLGGPAVILPHPVHGVGVIASWIPVEHQLIATNGTQKRGGAFVQVTVERRGHGAPPDRAVAKAAAIAALRTAPRGPAPAPPTG